MKLTIEIPDEAYALCFSCLMQKDGKIQILQTTMREDIFDGAEIKLLYEKKENESEA